MAVIEINTSFFPLAWVLYLCTPKASIDGGPPFAVPWRRPLQVPVAVGRHQVDVWVPYLFFSTMGRRTVVVDVGEGGGASIAWEPTWWLVLLPGKMRVNGVPVQDVVPMVQPHQQVAAVAGAWHPDPSGRHQQRWWDGQAWTQHVTDGGASFVDPSPLG